jgi:hypothetical protein
VASEAAATVEAAEVVTSAAVVEFEAEVEALPLPVPVPEDWMPNASSSCGVISVGSIS